MTDRRVRIHDGRLARGGDRVVAPIRIGSRDARERAREVGPVHGLVRSVPRRLAVRVDRITPALQRFEREPEAVPVIGAAAVARRGAVREGERFTLISEVRRFLRAPRIAIRLERARSGRGSDECDDREDGDRPARDATLGGLGRARAAQCDGRAERDPRIPRRGHRHRRDEPVGPVRRPAEHQRHADGWTARGEPPPIPTGLPTNMRSGWFN